MRTSLSDRRRPCSAPRAGFTLIEVVVALAVGALVLIVARTLLETLSDHAHAAITAAGDADRAANAELRLRAAVAQVEVGTKDVSELEGDARVARFTSWCATPDGWLERCATTLRLARRSSHPDDATNRAADSIELVLEQADREPLVVRRATRSARLLYLTSAAAGGHWLPAWTTGISAPLAIGVVLDADTLALWIGERG